MLRFLSSGYQYKPKKRASLELIDVSSANAVLFCDPRNRHATPSLFSQNLSELNQVSASATNALIRWL
jgi:hypothetical protein